MKTSGPILPTLILLLVGGLLALAGDPPAGRPKGPATLGELDAALTKATERTERLMTLAGKDVRFKLVELYLTYTVTNFGDRRRDVDAEKLLDIMSDDEAPMDLRQDAFKALTWKDAMRFDPDLVKKRDKHTPRADFCRSKVTRLLTKGDKYTRKFAHDLLVTYFPEHKADLEVATYDPVNGSKTQWAKTKAHWNKELR